MASVTLEVKGLKQAIASMEKDVQTFLTKADRKFKVAGTRMEAYAKAAAPVDKGFHRRNIRHVPNSPSLTTVLIAAADYASVLEFGFFGFVQVDEHTRTITQAFGQEIAPKTVVVDSHLRIMDRPARPHIVPAAERALKQLIEDLNELA